MSKKQRRNMGKRGSQAAKKYFEYSEISKVLDKLIRHKLKP